MLRQVAVALPISAEDQNTAGVVGSVGPQVITMQVQWQVLSQTFGQDRAQHKLSPFPRQECAFPGACDVSACTKPTLKAKNRDTYGLQAMRHRHKHRHCVQVCLQNIREGELA